MIEERQKEREMVKGYIMSASLSSSTDLKLIFSDAVKCKIFVINRMLSST